METVLMRKFHDVQVRVEQDEQGELWVPGEEIGQALEYAQPRKRIDGLFQKNRDVLDDLVYSSVLNLRTEAGSRDTRCYTEQGCYLLVMYSKQPRAREFQKWVAGVLAGLRREMFSGLRTENQRLKEALGEDRLELDYRAWKAERAAQKAEDLAKWNQKMFDELIKSSGGRHPDFYRMAQIRRFVGEVGVVPKQVALTPGGRALKLTFEV